MAERPLLDRGMFWVGAAAVVAAIGSVPIFIGIAEAGQNRSDLLADRAVLSGLAMEAFAAILLWWAITLYLAHGHALRHECPDPSAHRLAADSTPSAARAQLRSVLWQLREEVRAAIALLGRVSSTGRFWGLSAGHLEDAAWRKNRAQLGATPAMTELHDSLSEAFDHISRIKPLVFPRWAAGGMAKPGDNIDGALTSLRGAESKLDAMLRTLDHPASEGALGESDSLVADHKDV